VGLDGCGVDRVERCVKAEHDRRVTVFIVARGEQDFELVKGRIGGLAFAAQHGEELVMRRLDLCASATYGICCDHRSGGLAEGAGFHILTKTCDFAALERNIDSYVRATKRRTAVSCPGRGAEPLKTRHISCERQNAGRVEFDQIGVIVHGIFPANLA